MKTSRTVFFLLAYPLRKAPSQRFRVEAFLPLLQQQGISYRVHCFLDEQAWQHLYAKGASVQKAWGVFKGFISRLWVVLFVAPRYAYIFVHRGASPVGPPVFEWMLSTIFRKRIIFDFDDAIWIPSVTDTNRLAALVKCAWKIKYVCKWSYKITAGNDYLAAFARRHNSNVVLLPTCVDAQARFNVLQDQNTTHPVIGWTGSHSTLSYLNLVVPVLQRLEARLNFTFLVICNKPPSFRLRSLKYVSWKEATEIEDLLQMHIGIMPLLPDEWSEGKCGFKIIQYLSLGMPAVASPVGVNSTIVEHGINGFLCRSEEEWAEALEHLLHHRQCRVAMGRNGRSKIEAQYSIQAHSATFVGLFNETAEGVR